MQDRYDRPIAVGDIVLARPLDHSDPDRKHVVGTIGKLKQSTEDDLQESLVYCLSIGQVDCYRFNPAECELVITKDGALPLARVHQIG